MTKKSKSIFLMFLALFSLCGCSSKKSPTVNETPVPSKRENYEITSNQDIALIPPAPTPSEESPGELPKTEPENTNQPSPPSLPAPDHKVQPPTVKEPEPEPVGMSKEESQHWDTLTYIASKAQNFYSDNFSKTRLISKNGYLYNKAAETIIDTAYLCDREGLDALYHIDNVSLLLLNAKDMAPFAPSNLHQEEMGLTVFAAVQNTETNKFDIASANGKCATLSESQYEDLLNLYAQRHGKVARLKPSQYEYERILTFVRMFEGKYEKYYVRNITTDNKYASVVLSTKNSVADVRQYILKKDDGFWEVVMDNIEKEPRVAVAVNKAIPDFNLDMLPSYTISDFRMKTNFADVNQIMIDAYYINNINEIAYITGTGNFCFVILTNGKTLLFASDKAGWQITKAANASEAEKSMLSIDKNAPTFLIPDEY